jgi:hypothetical protein
MTEHNEPSKGATEHAPEDLLPERLLRELSLALAQYGTDRIAGVPLARIPTGLLDRVQIALMELRADKDRLDWLERTGAEVSLDREPEPRSLFVVHHVQGGRNDLEWREAGRGDSVREAIDAALPERAP